MPVNVWPAMLMLAAFVAVQASTTAVPGAGDVGGVAVNEVIVGAPLTVTIAWDVIVPAALVAVKV